MQRAIVDFGIDAADDRFAVLDCGHTQHVRHRPPFIDRPWVTTEAGRAGRLGHKLDCVCCDRFEMPASAECYRCTPVFDQDSVPVGLRREHKTRTGVWAMIEVLEGRLRYVVPMLAMDCVLTPAVPGVVVPEAEHYIEPRGRVRFQLAMYRSPQAE